MAELQRDAAADVHAAIDRTIHVVASLGHLSVWLLLGWLAYRWPVLAHAAAGVVVADLFTWLLKVVLGERDPATLWLDVALLALAGVVLLRWGPALPVAPEDRALLLLAAFGTLAVKATPVIYRRLHRA